MWTLTEGTDQKGGRSALVVTLIVAASVNRCAGHRVIVYRNVKRAAA